MGECYAAPYLDGLENVCEICRSVPSAGNFRRTFLAFPEKNISKSCGGHSVFRSDTKLADEEAFLALHKNGKLY